MIKIMVVDDHPVVRQGITKILTSSGKVSVTGEAGSLVELYESIKKTSVPDVLVLDLSLPGKSGFEGLTQVKNDFPNLPVLILSMHPEEQYALRALKAGASGYLTKECAPEQLVNAVETVARNERFISPAVANMLTDLLHTDRTGQPLHSTLSNREFEVLLFIGEGKPLTEVAKQFNVSVKTISTYRVRILEKMKMKTNAELIHYIVENDLRA